MRRLWCWLREHEWYTSHTPGSVGVSWSMVPPYVFERDGLIVSAPPCRRCGDPNPQAYGNREGAYVNRPIVSAQLTTAPKSDRVVRHRTRHPRADR